MDPIPQISEVSEKPGLDEVLIPQISEVSEKPGLDEVLQPFVDYKKKNNFKEHLKKQLYEQNFPENKKKLLFGIQGQTYDEYVEYYKKYKCITNKEPMIMKEEREECDQFIKNNDQIDYDKFEQKTLININLLKELYSQKQEKNDSNYAYHQLVSSKEDEIKELLEYNTPKQEIIDYLKAEYEELQQENYLEQIEKLIDQLQDKKENQTGGGGQQLQENPQNQEQIIESQQNTFSIPQFDNYAQKLLIIDNIKSGQIEQDFEKDEEMFQEKYQGLQKEIALKYYNFFKDNKIITDKEEDVMTQEKDNLFQAFLLLKEKNEKPENQSMQKNNEPDYEYFQ